MTLIKVHPLVECITKNVNDFVSSNLFDNYPLFYGDKGQAPLCLSFEATSVQSDKFSGRP